MVVQNAFSMGVDMAGADRLMLMHKVSLIQLLPISYQQQIALDAGRHPRRATRRGSAAPTRTRRTSSPSWPSRPNYFELYPEAQIPDDQLKAWLADRQGAIVGTRVGGEVRLEDRRQGARSRRRSGSRSRGRPGSSTSTASTTATRDFDKTNFFFHYEYLDENRRGAYGMVGWYVDRRLTTRRMPPRSAVASTASSRTRRPKRRRQPRRRSCRDSSTRSATSRR